MAREREKGNEAFRCGDAAQAVEHYAAALALGPSVALRANRAAAHLKLKQWDACIEDCTWALEAEPGHVKALVRRAAARLEVKRFESALDDAEAALALQPGVPSVAELRDKILRAMPQRAAKILIEEDDEDDEDAADAEDEEPERPGEGERGAGGREGGRPPAAPAAQTRVERRVLDTTDHGNGVSIEEFTEEEVAFMPSPSDAARDLKDRGNAAFRAGDLRGALLLYDESLAAHATPAVHANRALVLLGLDEFAAAEAACDAALSGDPENVKALHRRGVARRRLGRLEAALEDYRAAAGKLPGNAKIEQELAELLAEAVAERKQKQQEQRREADAAAAAAAAAEAETAEAEVGRKVSGKKAVVMIEESESEGEGDTGGGQGGLRAAAGWGRAGVVLVVPILSVFSFSGARLHADRMGRSPPPPPGRGRRSQAPYFGAWPRAKATPRRK